MPPGKMCVSEQLYTIEKILEHRIRKDGEFEYYVKWEGYSSEHNTWEPKEMFILPNVLLNQYHASLKSGTSDSSSSTPVKQDNPINNKANTVRKIQTNGKRNFLLKGDISTDEDIADLEPEKVLNINHLLRDEKLLVAKVKFKNSSAIKFVRATWVNKHYPQLVIAFYESRISWRDKSTQKLVKADYTNNA